MRAPSIASLLRTNAVGLVVVAGALLSLDAAAQAELKQHGVIGRIVLATELAKSTEWPVGDERERAKTTPSRIRRPSGRSVLLPSVEPTPDLYVVLDGENARVESPPPRIIKIEGMRFAPGQILLARPGQISIENKQRIKLTIVDKENQTLTEIAPGATGQVKLKAGEEVLSTVELPYARLSVRVLERAIILPFDKTTGELKLTPIDGGEYKLAFYLGAKLLSSQPLQLADDRVMFIEATVSAKEVVVPTIKDASVRVAVPQTPTVAPEPE